MLRLLSSWSWDCLHSVFAAPSRVQFQYTNRADGYSSNTNYEWFTYISPVFMSQTRCFFCHVQRVVCNTLL